MINLNNHWEMQIKNQSIILLHNHEHGYGPKGLKLINVGEDLEKLEFPYIASLINIVAGYDPAIPGIYSRDMKTCVPYL